MMSKRDEQRTALGGKKGSTETSTGEMHRGWGKWEKREVEGNDAEQAGDKGRRWW